MALPYLSLELPKSYQDLPYEHIRVSHVPASSPTPTPVVLVTLYRPGKNNAFTGTMTYEMDNAWKLFAADDRVKVIVVTGHGGKIFCAGADLEIGFQYGTDTPKTHRDGGGIVAMAIHRCPKPTIAAINGSAVGIGITMTLPMSIRIVSNKAKIGFVFARRGLVMEAASGYFLPRLIGYSKATHLVTTGAVYPSTSPLFSDLFSEVLEPEAVVPRALELADEIAKNTSTVSVAMNKALIWNGPDNAADSQLLTSQVIRELFTSKDKQEGVTSFMEKRQANFTGVLSKDAPSNYPWWSEVDADPKDDFGKSKL
jgi:enoyl-CoA hydratase/carnithine racemase